MLSFSSGIFSLVWNKRFVDSLKVLLFKIDLDLVVKFLSPKVTILSFENSVIEQCPLASSP